ncbi:hypothetical protein J4444_02730 [Candidatus Woesearchaeota archaeon]|nr:hypothetical protein [Candidatus Woesearchaeota archaeon]
MVNWKEEWVETVVLGLAALGFIISLLIQSVILSYLTIILSGFVAGRIFYIKRFSQPILPFILMIVGFLLGYILGSFWTSRFWIMVFFAVSFYASYELHLKKILVTFKSKDFVK